MARDSSNLPSLEDLGITAIINVSSSCPIHFDDKFKYKRISVEDAYDEDLLSRFREAASFIGEYACRHKHFRVAFLKRAAQLVLYRVYLLFVLRRFRKE